MKHSEYSLAPTDDLIRFWRSKVKVIQQAVKLGHCLSLLCDGRFAMEENDSIHFTSVNSLSAYLLSEL